MRHIAGVGRFVGTKPDQGQAQVTVPGFDDLRIHQRKVEAAFFGLDQFPAHRADDGIEVKCGEVVEHGLQVLDAGSGGIIQFAGEKQERFEVNEKLLNRAILPDNRQRRLLLGLNRRNADEYRQK